MHYTITGNAKKVTALDDLPADPDSEVPLIGPFGAIGIATAGKLVYFAIYDCSANNYISWNVYSRYGLTVTLLLKSLKKAGQPERHWYSTKSLAPQAATLLSSVKLAGANVRNTTRHALQV